MEQYGPSQSFRGEKALSDCSIGGQDAGVQSRDEVAWKAEGAASVVSRKYLALLGRSKQRPYNRLEATTYRANLRDTTLVAFIQHFA